RPAFDRGAARLGGISPTAHRDRGVAGEGGDAGLRPRKAVAGGAGAARPRGCRGGPRRGSVAGLHAARDPDEPDQPRPRASGEGMTAGGVQRLGFFSETPTATEKTPGLPIAGTRVSREAARLHARWRSIV